MTPKQAFELIKVCILTNGWRAHASELVEALLVLILYLYREVRPGPDEPAPPAPVVGGEPDGGRFEALQILEMHFGSDETPSVVGIGAIPPWVITWLLGEAVKRLDLDAVVALIKRLLERLAK